MKHKISIEFTGYVFKTRFFVEENEVDVVFNNENTWKRVLDKYPVLDGKIDVKLKVKAWNSTPWKLKITVDDRIIEECDGVVQDGVSEIEKTINIPRA